MRLPQNIWSVEFHPELTLLSVMFRGSGQGQGWTSLTAGFADIEQDVSTKPQFSMKRRYFGGEFKIEADTLLDFTGSGLLKPEQDKIVCLRKQVAKLRASMTA
jgi:hypothetical protein